MFHVGDTCCKGTRFIGGREAHCFQVIVLLSNSYHLQVDEITIF